MTEPPFEVGAPQRTVKVPDEGETETAVGLPGRVAAPGVPAVQGLDGDPVPTALLATVSIHTWVPGTRPPMTHGDATAVHDAKGVLAVAVA
ncbi:MAG: hypothetical protein ACKOE2_03765 [Actinomycetales bacterium]